MTAEDRKVVAIGGGHGLARTLDALVLLGIRPTAVVAVADDGGSSGRLREGRDLVALGDMRMALQTLAAPSDLGTVFTHRFDSGAMEGHALGNLVMLALLEQADGDLVVALDRVASALDARGRVLPCTTASVHLGATVDGVDIQGQVAVATTAGRKQALHLTPPRPPACPEAVAAIAEADAIVLGPGSLFTSIIANLLVPGIAEAVGASSGPLIYVGNLLTQPGETSGMSLQEHLDALLAHIPGSASVTPLLHHGPTPSGAGEEMGGTVGGARVVAPHHADLAQRLADGQVGGAHDPRRLADALSVVLAQPPDGRTAQPRRSGVVHGR